MKDIWWFRAPGFAVCANELLWSSVILGNLEDLHKQGTENECEVHPEPRGTQIIQANILQ